MAVVVAAMVVAVAVGWGPQPPNIGREKCVVCHCWCRNSNCSFDYHDTHQESAQMAQCQKFGSEQSCCSEIPAGYARGQHFCHM